jgi:hypothetical protein
MSSINLSRDTESADYLNAIRKELAQSKAKNTNATALLEYILDFYNTINISNAVTLNNNKTAFANTSNMSNSMSRTDQLTGTFLVDTAKSDFSDVDDGLLSYTFLLSDSISYILLNDGISKLIGSDAL